MCGACCAGVRKSRLKSSDMGTESDYASGARGGGEANSTPIVAAGSFSDGTARERPLPVSLASSSDVNVGLPAVVGVGDTTHMASTPAKNQGASQAEAQARMVREATASHAQRTAQAQAHQALQAAQEAAAAVVARIDTMEQQATAPALHQQGQTATQPQGHHTAPVAPVADLAVVAVASVSGPQMHGLASGTSPSSVQGQQQGRHGQHEPPIAAQLPHRSGAPEQPVDADGVVQMQPGEGTILFNPAPSEPVKVSRRRRAFLTDEERRHARIMKNRRTAEESRQRRQRRMAELEREVKSNDARESALAAEKERLMTDNAALKAENALLKADNAALKACQDARKGQLSSPSSSAIAPELETKLRNDIMKLKSDLYDKGEVICALKEKIAASVRASSTPKDNRNFDD